jgi:hypothetical protein
MSKEVIDLLHKIQELKPFFTPLETILRVAQKIRPLNDPELNKHALQTDLPPIILILCDK